MRSRVAVPVLVIAISIALPPLSDAQWVQTAGPAECRIRRLAVAGGKVFTAVEGHGLYSSADEGEHWSRVRAELPPGQEITCLEEIGGQIFAGTAEGAVCFSTDGGAAWRELEIKFNERTYDREVRSFARIGAALFVGISDGLYVSDDYASSAKALPLELPGSGNVRGMAVMGTDLFVGGTRNTVFLVKNDGKGRTVYPFEFPPTNWPGCFAVKGPYLYAGADGGVFLSSDRGGSWTKISPDMSPHPYMASIKFSGPDLLAVMKYPGDPAFPGPTLVRFSKDGGKVWKMAYLGPLRASTECYALTDTCLFAGTTRGFLVSKDRGATWKRVGSGLPVASRVEAIASVGTDLFASTVHGDWRYLYGQVHLSSDGGKTWRIVDQEVPLHKGAASLAAAGPNLFAGLVGPREDSGPGVFMTPNRGRTWVAVNRGLPPEPDVYLLAASGGSLYAQTSEGVFISTDNGTSWALCGEGLNARGVTCLTAFGQDLLAGVLDWAASPGVYRSFLPSTIEVSAGGQYLFAGGPPSTGWLFILAKGSPRWKRTRIHLSRGIDTLAMIGRELFIGTHNGLYLCERYIDSIKPLKLKLSDKTETASEFDSSDVPVKALAAVGADLYVGTDKGVFLVQKRGTGWVRTGMAMPANCCVTSFALVGQDLYAGTRGSGVWRLPLSR